MPESWPSSAPEGTAHRAGSVAEGAAAVNEELLQDTPAGVWVPDALPGCSRMTIPLGEDFEGPVNATLVRYDDGEGQHYQAPVLQIHGWTDYFYNLPMAAEWNRSGHRFYALDLRKYGRSLRTHQTPGHIDNLAEYDAEIIAALQLIAADNPEAPAPLIHAHSTGGLVTALFAERNSHLVSALVLNSPWLEVPGHAPARTAAESIVGPFSAMNPTATVKLPRLEVYWESLSSEANGEWELHPLWRPPKTFPMTVGWLKAVFAGHRKVRQGLDMDLPVLVLLSTSSVLRTQWTPEHMEADGVLDVELLARRSVKLGRCVSVLRIPRAMHDVFASAEAVRLSAFRETARWLRAYAPQQHEGPTRRVPPR